MTRDTEQEVKPCKFVSGACIHCEATERGDCQGWVSSPKREWQGLTDEEIKTTLSQLYCDINQMKLAPADRPQKETVGFLFARAIETKLKEKNNG